MHAAVYRQYKEFISSVLAGGVTEFEQIGGALDRIADAYDNADQIVSLDFNKIYTA
jgi:hypothetical protein